MSNGLSSLKSTNVIVKTGFVSVGLGTETRQERIEERIGIIAMERANLDDSLQ